MCVSLDLTCFYWEVTERCFGGTSEFGNSSFSFFFSARRRLMMVGVSAQKVEVFKKGSRADFLHYTASIVMVDHGSTRNTPRR